MKEITITEQDVDVRLDRVLKREMPNVALTRIFRYLRKGNIKVNKKKKKENYRLQLDDTIRIFVDLRNSEENRSGLFLSFSNFANMIFPIFYIFSQ